MNEKRTPGWIERHPLCPAVNAAGLNLAVATSWSDATELTAYLESPLQCDLWKSSLKDFVSRFDSGQAWEGRLFDDNCEVRLWRQQNGQVCGCVVKQVSDGLSPQAERVNIVKRYYYLIGRYDEGSSPPTFSEDRYPGEHFKHPVNRAPQKNDRARILVHEYEPAEPDWSEADGMSEDERIKWIEQRLNQPRVIAHRFVKVDFGTGSADEQRGPQAGESNV